MINNIQGIILAAGKSTRFNTGRTKLAEPVCGKPLVLHPTQVLGSLTDTITVVVGHNRETITDLITNAANDAHYTFVEQTEQRGTGHAIACTRDTWTREHILIINGDTPLIKHKHIEELYNHHIATDAAMSCIGAYTADPDELSYGRIIDYPQGKKIVEKSHYSVEKYGERQQYPINAGIYILKRSFLEEYIDKLAGNSVNQEIYFTDLAELASQAGLTVSTTTIHFDYTRGINTVEELWVCEHIYRSELIKNFMRTGVRFIAPQTTHLDAAVKIEAGSVIGAGVQLRGNTTIGNNCTIDAGCVIDDSTLEDNVILRAHCVIDDSYIGTGSILGAKCTAEGPLQLDANTIVPAHSLIALEDDDTNEADQESLDGVDLGALLNSLGNAQADETA